MNKAPTTTGGRYYIYIDGEKQEGYHRREPEAFERASKIKIQNPDSKVEYQSGPTELKLEDISDDGEEDDNNNDDNTPDEEPQQPSEGDYDDKGWTNLYPENAEKVFYVSSSEGNDDNDGLSPNTPVKTLSAGYNKLRDGQSDRMLLKAGDTWDRPDERRFNWVKSGKSAKEPIVLSTYGDGPRPVLRDAQLGNTHVDNPESNPGLQHLRFVGIHLKSSSEGGAGIRWMAKSKDVLFEDIKISGYKDNIVLHGDSPQSLTDIRIRRCIVIDSYSTDSHSQGIYSSGVNGLLLEENAFDHNGWNPDIEGAEKTIFNHNMYIQRDNKVGTVTIRGNISTRASSHGLQHRAGGHVEDNLFVYDPCGMFNRGNSIENVVMYSNNIGDRPRGFGIDVFTPLQNSQVKDNIAITRAGGLDDRPGMKVVDNTHKNKTRQEGIKTVVENNKVYDWYNKNNKGMTVSEDAKKWAVINTNYTSPDVQFSNPEYSFSEYLNMPDSSQKESFISFINEARNRGRGEWNTKYIAKSFNDEIRKNYEVT